MVNDIITGISKKLRDTFGGGYKINIDEKRQGFTAPCFFIVFLTSSQELVVRNRYYRTYSFDIQYFPESQSGITRECNEVADKLLMVMEYINLSNDLIRGTKMSAEEHDDVLHFFVDYDVFVFQVLDEVPKMQILKQTQNLKE